MLFVPGATVKSNDSYYATTGRRVTGYIVAPTIDLGDQIIVFWETQEGNTEPNLVGNKVIMNPDHVELYNK